MHINFQWYSRGECVHLNFSSGVEKLKFVLDQNFTGRCILQLRKYASGDWVEGNPVQMIPDPDPCDRRQYQIQI